MSPRFSFRWRLQFLGLLMLLGLGAILGKLWLVQVAHGPEWTAKIRGSSEATVRIPSVRGEIRDRNGVTLVQNRASYEVDFYLPEMVKGYRERVGPPPLTEYRSTIHGMPKNLKEPDIVKIVNSGVVPRLDDLDLARDYNSVQLQRHFRTNTEVPYPYIKDIDFETMAKFSEHDVGLPGVDITIKPVRSYVYGALASHLLGYVGAPDDTNKEEAKKYTFYQSDVEGKSNIEKTMDEYLKGKPGVRYMRRNAKGQIDGVLREEAPQAGANVDLTIDARIQAIVEEALRAVGRGAAVVVDPNNGDILAMATVPSFNPNTFIPSIKAKDWDELKKAPADPLINRAISAFPPGSTYKLVTALAGLQKGLGNARYDCGGGVGYGDHFFKCHIAEKGRTHGQLGLAEAIKVSCNSYFYQMGNAAGIDAIDEVGDLLSLGKATGVEITGEQPGVLPGPDWMRIHYPRERWSSAYTANVSIGQGYVLVSPLQMAMVYATIANGGVAYQPRLVRNVVGMDGKPILNEKGEPVVSQKPKVRGDLRYEVGGQQLEQARRALLSVVNEGGTGRQSAPAQCAGRGQDWFGAGDDGWQERYDRLVRLLRALRQAEVYRRRDGAGRQRRRGGRRADRGPDSRTHHPAGAGKIRVAACLARAGPKAEPFPISRIGRFQGFGRGRAARRRNESELTRKAPIPSSPRWAPLPMWNPKRMPRAASPARRWCAPSRSRRRRPGNPAFSNDFLAPARGRRQCQHRTPAAQTAAGAQMNNS